MPPPALLLPSINPKAELRVQGIMPPAAGIENRMLMKNKLNAALVLLVLVASSEARAQKLELTPFYGYQVGGGFDIRSGKADIKSSPVYGIALDVFVNPEWQFEAFYSRQDTEFTVKESPPFGPSFKYFDVSVEYFQGGFLYEFDSQKSVRPFLLVGLGATRFDPKPAELSSEWRFSIVGGGGVKLFVSEHIGFRFQGNLLVPFLRLNSRLFCSMPRGCLIDVDVATTLQAGGTAGIILAF